MLALRHYYFIVDMQYKMRRLTAERAGQRRDNISNDDTRIISCIGCDKIAYTAGGQDRTHCSQTFY